MNYSTAVMLVNPAIRAIATTYEPDKDTYGNNPPKRYTFKTTDPNVKMGDLVLVPTDTRHGFTVNKVIEVDIDVDFDSNLQIKWIASRIDLANYEQTLEMESQLIDVIKKGELRKRREDIKRNTMDAVSAGEIDALPIAKLGAPTTVQPQTPPDNLTGSGS